MKTNSISRRNFLQKTAMTTGLASVVPLGMASTSNAPGIVRQKSDREIWIAGFSQMDLVAENPAQMAEQAYEILKQVIVYQPDFVVLPESFPYVMGYQLTIEEKVAISDGVQDRLSAFAKENNCYVICPAYTSRKGKNFNSAVVFDRKGKMIGEYHKIHATMGEIRNRGITCGPVFQPVIETEYGPVGIQICYDINWDDGFQMLSDQGARIIFWLSAFDGGIQVNNKASLHKCFVVTSTLKNISKVCDISGETIAQSGIWNPNLFVAPINMDKEFFPTYNYLKEYQQIEQKYGRKVRITTYHAEEWTVIESLSPDVKVRDIMKEFNMLSHIEGIAEATAFQNQNRA